MRYDYDDDDGHPSKTRLQYLQLNQNYQLTSAESKTNPVLHFTNYPDNLHLTQYDIGILTTNYFATLYILTVNVRVPIGLFQD